MPGRYWTSTARSPSPLIALLHFLPDDEDPYRVVSTLVDTLPRGSYLLLSHGTADQHPELRQETESAYKKGAIPLRMRPRSEVEPFFCGLELVEPGLVFATEWYQGNRHRCANAAASTRAWRGSPDRGRMRTGRTSAFRGGLDVDGDRPILVRSMGRSVSVVDARRDDR